MKTMLNDTLMTAAILRGKFTEEQLLEAKKVVKVVTVINGERYIENFEGNGGLAVTMRNDNKTTGLVRCDPNELINFIMSLISRLKPEYRMIVIRETFENIDQ